MRLGRVVVGGHSMAPALEHGDHLLYLTGLRPRVGTIVVALDPRDPARWIVKRVVKEIAASGPGAREAVLASDLEGHERLAVRAEAIVGRAVLRYRPLSRVRFL